MSTLRNKAEQILAATRLITLASVNESGYPRPATVVRLPSEDGAIYVATGTSSAKTAHFRANPKAGVSIVEGGNSIIYTGIVEIITNEATKRALWSDWMLEHFRGGVNDPEYTILRFIPQTAVYWIDGEFANEELRQ